MKNIGIYQWHNPSVRIKDSTAGITLIALVITILVLLILAGVSINMLSGDNGIVTKVREAKDTSTMGEEIEYVKLAYNSAKIKKLANDVDSSDIQEELDNSVGENKTEVSFNEEDRTFDVLFFDTQNSYSINGNEVTSIKKQELHITNYNELLYFANRVNDGEDFEKYIVYLDNDITVEDDEWVVIGYYGGRDNPSMVFKGIFEGNNHTIKELNLSSNGDGYLGLFYENQGTIKNLNVEVVNCTGNRIAGGICAKNEKNIINCSVNINANVDSSFNNQSPSVGGICGSNRGTIKNCIVKGEIKTKGRYMKSGGITGDNSGIVISCKNEAIIDLYASYDGSSSCAGGIVGNISEGQVIRCINVGNLLLRCSNGGGIAGENNKGIVNECVNKGNITSDDPIVYYEIAGLVGSAVYNAIITNSYNIGNINLTKDSYNNHTGSVAGLVSKENENGKIENCYNAGSITISSYVSGYSAFGSSVSIATNCYYNNETSSLTENTATGRTTSEMKSASFVSQLGSSYVADTKNINNGYPVLSWENQ